MPCGSRQSLVASHQSQSSVSVISLSRQSSVVGFGHRSQNGMRCAHRSVRMAKSLEELQVYQKALEASAEVSAILGRDSFKRDPRLRDQLGSSSASVASLISEGFEQSTDRYFAQYLYRSRGSSSEARTQLVVA